MYIPRANEEDRIPVLHKFMEDQPFASLITMGSSGLFASHIPMVLEQNGTVRQLRGHISRANTQWRDYTPSVEALAIFSGPQHYITPNWYPEKQETGKVVPTWNYVVVHAYGYLKIVEDGEWLLAHLADRCSRARVACSVEDRGRAEGLYRLTCEGNRRAGDND
jgi:transcriptional regulator